MKNKKRFDQILFEKGYYKSRSESRFAILTGKVFIDGQIRDKPGKYYDEEKVSQIKIIEEPRYVSRAGYKLEKAIKTFPVNISGMICLDVGCSTGGFTDCLLQNRAKKVYAVDVGYGQFDYRLRQDKRVVLLERTNIRYLKKDLILDKIDIITVDVSFISIRKFLHNLVVFCDDDFDMIILIKPQFEAKKEDVIKGIVKSKRVHKQVMQTLYDYFKKIGLYIHHFTYSPIKGPKGNIEFLAHIKNIKKRFHLESINNTIENAHAEFSS